MNKNIVIAAVAVVGCASLLAFRKVDPPKSAPKALDPVKLSPVKPSPEFPNATIGIRSVTADNAGKDSAKVTFEFELKNYELKSQTSDKDTKLCNNSGQGQHIHFILDNQPYKALYDPKNQVTLAKGSEHYLMAFLSRSYHESIKSKGAALVYHFRVDESGKVQELKAPRKPMIFYSRPKGDYLGADTVNVLLDYYVWNCDLSAKGYKVQSVIMRPQSDPKVDTLSKWEPMFINNLSGNCKVMLQLLDKKGRKVEGPNTQVVRDIRMLPVDPMKK
jgi:hypothetical protein